LGFYVISLFSSLVARLKIFKLAPIEVVPHTHRVAEGTESGTALFSGNTVSLLKKINGMMLL